MIEAVMIFVLGAITCGLLVLLVMPTIWNRAVRLTRARLEATSPMTLAEVQGEKDLMRAEFAMAARRLERDVEKLQEMASRQVIEINRKREALALIAAERDEKDQIIDEMEQHAEALQRQTHEADEKSAEVSAQLRNSNRKLEQRQQDIDDLLEQVEDLQTNLEAQKIENVAGVTEQDRLEAKIAELKSEKSQLTADMASVEIDLRMRETDLGNQKAQVDRLEERLEMTRRDLADREEALSRRSQELIRLRNAQQSQPNAASAELQAKALDLETKNVMAQTEISRLVKEIDRLKEDRSASAQPQAATISSKTELDVQLQKVRGERDTLKERVAELEKGFSAAMAEEAAANSALRKLLHEIGDKVAELPLDEAAQPSTAKPSLIPLNGGKSDSTPANRSDDPMIDRILRDAEALKESFRENDAASTGKTSKKAEPIPFPSPSSDENDRKAAGQTAGE